MALVEYGLIFGRTPSVAEAECIMVWLVTKDFWIFDLIAKMSMQDHAATHMEALQKTKETVQHTSPVEAYCIMHGLNNKKNIPYIPH
eukprot:1857974-Ditylum_brightwellii.AAC.1